MKHTGNMEYEMYIRVLGCVGVYTVRTSSVQVRTSSIDAMIYICNVVCRMEYICDFKI